MRQKRGLYMGLIFGASFGIFFSLFLNVFAGRALEDALFVGAVGALFSVIGWYAVAAIKGRSDGAVKK